MVYKAPQPLRLLMQMELLQDLDRTDSTQKSNLQKINIFKRLLKTAFFLPQKA